MNKVIVFVFGPGCAGKSSALKGLAERNEGSYLISYDKLKWGVAGYHRDIHKELVRQLTFGLLEKACEQELLIWLDMFRLNEVEYGKLVELARKYDYRLLPVYMVASDDVLIERFRERVAQVEASGGHLSVGNESLFKELIHKDTFFPDDVLELDSGVLSEGEIVERIMEDL